MANVANLTKASAVASFRELYYYNQGGLRAALAEDRTAVREDWFNFVDSLHRDGIITEKQCDTWTFPWERN